MQNNEKIETKNICTPYPTNIDNNKAQFGFLNTSVEIDCHIILSFMSLGLADSFYET
jgi:hypothetical protein